MLLLGIAALLLLAFAIFRRRDPRMLRNGVLLTGAIAFGALGALSLAAEVNPIASFALLLLAVALPVSVVVFGVALIANGVTMLRREGRSLGNQLSLIAGVLVFALPIAAVLIALVFGTAGVAIAALLALASLYASAAFTSFAVYSVVYGRMRHRLAPAAIVVHGSGLRKDGTLTALLRGRVDRGLAVYRAERARGRSPLLIPSGGRGSDEARSEASAMTEYLAAQGVPSEDLLPEDRSTTTRENIEYSTELLRHAARPGPLLLVTSDYHVLRTASLARKLGVDAQVVGARTARYYVPSAFLREFAALLIENKWVSVIALAPLLVLAVGILIGGLLGSF
ncbi:MAG: YdcF family protein [Microbacteriaceae bacterium]